VLVFVTIGLREVQAHALLKLALAALVCVPACFLAAGALRRLPAVRRVL
jgi:hypothetical protein